MRRMLPALILLALSCPAFGATEAELLLCGSIEDPGRRLSCYDTYVRALYERTQRQAEQRSRKQQALARPPPPQTRAGSGTPAQPTAQVSVAEIADGFSPLRGRVVTAQGVLLVTADAASLYADATGTLWVSVSLTHLDRKSFIAVSDACAAGCHATVTGRLTTASLGPQILAEKVTLPR